METTAAAHTIRPLTIEWLAADERTLASAAQTLADRIGTRDEITDRADRANRNFDWRG